MIAHQSDPVTLIGSHQNVVPIFCVASNHSVDTLYDWTCEEVVVGVSSPVLYVEFITVL